MPSFYGGIMTAFGQEKEPERGGRRYDNPFSLSVSLRPLMACLQVMAGLHSPVASPQRRAAVPFR